MSLRQLKSHVRAQLLRLTVNASGCSLFRSVCCFLPPLTRMHACMHTCLPAAGHMAAQVLEHFAICTYGDLCRHVLQEKRSIALGASFALLLPTRMPASPALRFTADATVPAAVAAAGAAAAAATVPAAAAAVVSGLKIERVVTNVHIEARRKGVFNRDGDYNGATLTRCNPMLLGHTADLHCPHCMCACTICNANRLLLTTAPVPCCNCCCLNLL